MDDLVRDMFNPKFVHFSPVTAEELDGLGQLPKARIADHIDEAIFTWCTSVHGQSECRDDNVSTLRDLYIESMGPVFGKQNLRIDIWVENINESSCVYGFLCSSEDGITPYARGERTIVKVDPNSRRPSAWSAPFRRHQSELLKDLQAYA